MMIRRVWGYISFWHFAIIEFGIFKTPFLWWTWAISESWVSWWSFRFQVWRKRGDGYYYFLLSIFIFLQLMIDLARSSISTSYAFEAWFLLRSCNFELCRLTRTPIQLPLFIIGNASGPQSNPSLESLPDSANSDEATRWFYLIWLGGFGAGLDL